MNPQRPKLADVFVAFAMAALAGCGEGGAPSAGDELSARTALTKALDAWVAGTAAADLRSQDPEIIVVDQQWTSGAKLVDYEVVGTGEFDGKNLRTPVRLTVASPLTRGRPVKTDAQFIIGLDPVVTVVRVME